MVFSPWIIYTFSTSVLHKMATLWNILSLDNTASIFDRKWMWHVKESIANVSNFYSLASVSLDVFCMTI